MLSKMAVMYKNEIIVGSKVPYCFCLHCLETRAHIKFTEILNLICAKNEKNILHSFQRII